MGLMIRILFPLIAYACVATVITAGIGYGYLRKSGKLDDEKLFRIAAVIHGVDLDKIEKPDAKTAADTPPEEASYDQRQQQTHAATLQFDAKRKQLADMLVQFDFLLKQLNVATSQYSRLRDSVEDYLKMQQSTVLDEQMSKVREQLESLDAKKQSKVMLVKMIEDQRIDEVIALLGAMKAQSRREILRAFNTDADMEMLYRVQRKMLDGEPTRSFIGERLKELEQLKQQDK